MWGMIQREEECSLGKGWDGTLEGVKEQQRKGGQEGMRHFLALSARPAAAIAAAVAACADKGAIPPMGGHVLQGSAPSAAPPSAPNLGRGGALLGGAIINSLERATVLARPPLDAQRLRSTAASPTYIINYLGWKRVRAALTINPLLFRASTHSCHSYPLSPTSQRCR